MAKNNPTPRSQTSRKYKMKYCPIHGIFYLKQYPHNCAASTLPKIESKARVQGWKKGRK